MDSAHSWTDFIVDGHCLGFNQNWLLKEDIMTFWLIIAAWIGVIVGFVIGTFWWSAQTSRALEEARTLEAARIDRMLHWKKEQQQHMRESWRNAAKDN